MTPDIYDSKEYIRSRKAYLWQCAFEYLASLLVADAFLANVLNYLGVSDALTGIVSSFLALAFVFQLLSFPLLQLPISRKSIVLIFDGIGQISFLLLYIVPLLPLPGVSRQIAAVGFVFLGYVSLYAVGSICFRFANSYVDPAKRGSYSGVKELVSLVAGGIFSFAVGRAVDVFNEAGNQRGAFLFISILYLAVNIVNFSLLSAIKKDDYTADVQNKKSLKDILAHTLGNPNFRNVILMTAFCDISKYAVIGFVGVYKTNDLALTMSLIQIIAIGGNIPRILLSKPFGRYADRHSFAKAVELAMFIAAGAFLSLAFCTKETWYLIIVYTVLYSISAAGSGQSAFNISYSYLESDYITEGMALKSSIGGLCGFLTSLVAGLAVSNIQKNGLMLFGRSVNAQQLLGAVACILAIGAACFIHFVVAKQKRILQ